MAVSTAGMVGVRSEGRWRDRPAASVAAGLALFAVPFTVALTAARRPDWYPVLDRASFELRLRDVGGPHTPLVGVVGRLQSGGHQGNHPGPLAFYVMAPAYRLLGGSPAALQAAVVWAHALALGLALWLAARRGGPLLAAGVGATVALLLRGIGFTHLVDPWNPYLALTWFLAFLVAVWAVLDGDRAALPVAVLTGSFCAQSHVEYVPLVGALGLLAAVWLVVRRERGRRERARRGPGPDAPAPPDRGRWAPWRWVAGSAALAVLLWLPLALDEWRRSPGNVQILIGQFRDATDPPAGLVAGTRALLVNADPTKLALGRVVGEYHIEGSVLPAGLLLAAWAVAAVAAVRAGPAPVVRLHAVVATGFAVGALAMSRVTGPLWFWLGLWGAVLAALAVMATAWTAVALLSPRAPTPEGGDGPGDRAHDAGGRGRAIGVLVGLAVAATGLATAGATSADVVDAKLSDRLGDLVPPTVAAIEAGDVPGTGRDGTYVVTSDDPVDLGMHAIGLVDALDRRGFDVGMEPGFRAAVTDHRTMGRGEATATIHLAVGPAIDAWRDRPDATEVAYLDHRTPAEREEYDRAHRELAAGLEAIDRHDLVPLADHFVLALSLDRDVPRHLRERADRLMQIGLPTAIFVAPGRPTAPRASADGDAAPGPGRAPRTA